MKRIFKLNAMIAICYTAFLVATSFLFSSTGKAFILGFVYMFIGCIHFMAVGIMMAINHFKSNIDARNGYMASFGFIWLFLLVVQVVGFHFR